jgi:hypothetical protein
MALQKTYLPSVNPENHLATTGHATVCRETTENKSMLVHKTSK